MSFKHLEDKSKLQTIENFIRTKGYVKQVSSHNW